MIREGFHHLIDHRPTRITAGRRTADSFTILSHGIVRRPTAPVQRTSITPAYDTRSCVTGVTSCYVADMVIP
jgi:hypothetical protein